MLFPDRFLGQVEPLQHPEAEASEVVEVADPPEEEQLHLPQEEQELQQPEPLQPELLQLEPLQEQLPQELPVQALKPVQPLEQAVHPQEQKLMLPQVRNQMHPEVQTRHRELLLLPQREPERLPVQKHQEQRMAETMQRNRLKP